MLSVGLDFVGLMTNIKSLYPHCGKIPSVMLSSFANGKINHLKSRIAGLFQLGTMD
jgi:hypothetical protein